LAIGDNKVSFAALWSVGHILFAIYLIIGPGAMLGLIASVALGYSRMNRLLVRKYPLPDPPPHATILVPAKDEAGKIRECITAVLSQDYPNFDVIAIDDRSTDGTAQILEELAGASAGRLKVLRIPEDGLPQGWAGKVHALHTGASQTNSPWLFFIDSDVVAKPDALSRVISISAARQYDAVSLLPALRCNSFMQKLVLPVAAGVWSVVHAISWTNHDRVNVALANGQVFLIRRAAYEKAGGHANPRVRHALAEDVQLMRAIKSAGFRTRFLLGHQIASTRMYETVRQAFGGWARIFATTNELSPWRILLAIGFILVSATAGWAALGWGIYVLDEHKEWDWLAAAMLHAVLTVVHLVPAYTWSGNPRWCALFFPISSIALLMILSESLNLCRTGRITWRGTSYAFR